MKETTIIYQEEDLDTVMGYFVKGYEIETLKTEWFLDPIKNKVIFKLFVEDDQ